MNGCFTLQSITFCLDVLSSGWLDTVIKTKPVMNNLKQELDENIFVLCQLLRNLLKHMLNVDSLEEGDDETQTSLSTANTLINEKESELSSWHKIPVPPRFDGSEHVEILGTTNTSVSFIVNKGIKNQNCRVSEL